MQMVMTFTGTIMLLNQEQSKEKMEVVKTAEVEAAAQKVS